MLHLLSHLPGPHKPFYIFTGVLIAIVGSWLVANVRSKAMSSKGERQTLMLLIAGVCLGGTVWSAHFVWMLGATFAFPHSYELDGLVLSLIVAISTATLGIYIPAIKKSLRMNLLAGIVIGSGIAIMHYVGVLSIKFPGSRVLHYDLAMVSWGMGVLASSAALCLPTMLSIPYPKVMTALLLAVGIFIVHYVGMSALELHAGFLMAAESSLDDLDLVFAVIFVAFMIMGLASIAFAMDTRSSSQRFRDMEHRAFHDNLTGLPNRAMLEDTLGIIANMVSAGGKLVVVNFDLNRFKDINDVHGHAAGDQVLVAVARRLRNSLRGGEFVCRVGGDEFVAFKRQVTDRAEAEEFAVRLRDAITPDIEWNGKLLNVGSSLGLALYPDHGIEIRELLVKADLAMYRAKRDRMGIPIFYEASIDDENMEKSALSIDLRKAIENGQMKIVFQQQNDIDSGEIVGYEALARWTHPTKGAVGPDVFIPLAERDGGIYEIGEWVLREACRQAASWSKPMKIAVNVTARQLANDSLPRIIHDAMKEADFQASLLEIEITESGIIADAVQAMKIISEIKELGVSIVMDDFGTGYSSLSTLRSFPFDKIKIDKSFIAGVAESSQSQAIVKSTIILANALEIAVLAEGVETEEDLDFLRREGCKQVQGFLFGHHLTTEMIKAA